MQHPMIHTQDSLSLGPWYRLQSTDKTFHLAISSLLMVQRLSVSIKMDSCIRCLLVNTHFLLITVIDLTTNTHNVALIRKEELRRLTEKEQARNPFKENKASRQTLIQRQTKVSNVNGMRCLKPILYKQPRSRATILCQILYPMAMNND